MTDRNIRAIIVGVVVVVGYIAFTDYRNRQKKQKKGVPR